jgi:hypothetical protein
MTPGLRDTNTTDPWDAATLRIVTLAIIFARQLSFETFVTLLNPTAT